MDRSGEIVVEDNESFDLSSSDEDEDGEAPKEAYANVGLMEKSMSYPKKPISN